MKLLVQGATSTPATLLFVDRGECSLLIHMCEILLSFIFCTHCDTPNIPQEVTYLPCRCQSCHQAVVTLSGQREEIWS